MNWTNIISLIMSLGMMVIGMMSLYLSMKGDQRSEIDSQKNLSNMIVELKTTLNDLRGTITEIKNVLLDKVSKDVFNSEINGLKNRMDKIENKLKN